MNDNLDKAYKELQEFIAQNMVDKDQGNYNNYTFIMHCIDIPPLCTFMLAKIMETTWHLQY